MIEHAAEASDRANGYNKVSSQAPVQMTREELDVLTATNRYRKAQGLPPLEPDARLTAIARLRSQDMAKRNYFSHITPDGGDVFSLMRNQRVKFWAAGENLARNDYPMNRVTAVAMEGWIKSPGHRANLVHPSFGHLGVGMAVVWGAGLGFSGLFAVEIMGDRVKAMLRAALGMKDDESKP